MEPFDARFMGALEGKLLAEHRIRRAKRIDIALRFANVLTGGLLLTAALADWGVTWICTLGALLLGAGVCNVLNQRAYRDHRHDLEAHEATIDILARY